MIYLACNINSTGCCLLANNIKHDDLAPYYCIGAYTWESIVLTFMSSEQTQNFLANVGLMLGQRRIRLASIKSTLGQHLIQQSRDLDPMLV